MLKQRLQWRQRKLKAWDEKLESFFGVVRKAEGFRNSCTHAYAGLDVCLEKT